MRLHIFILVTFLAGCQSGATSNGSLEEHSEAGTYMGTEFQITALSHSIEHSKLAVEAAYKEVVRIEALISSWDEKSETSEINRNAGIQPVSVDDELYQLIYRSKKISELSNGIFDISFASIDKVWKFDGSMESIPTEDKIAASVALINYENIVLDPTQKTVYLTEKGMKIGFGGIGKGYAANRCKMVMEEMGIENGVVNAGGDLITWGKQKNGDDWSIGIANPEMKNTAFSWLKISDLAVVTSGNYERFVEFDGIKYCHIIHPKTGWPAELMTSVTIICPDAEVADAFATTVFILGAEKGIQFVNNIKDVECLIIDENGTLHYSKNISLNYYKEDE